MKSSAATRSDAVSGSVLLAGGTGGLGAGVLRTLLAAGWSVSATWFEEREHDRVLAEFGDESGLTLIEADLMTESGAAAAVAGVEGLKAIVDLVGGWAGGAATPEVSLEDFDHIVALNLRPLFLLARAGIPVLVENGGGTFVGVAARNALAPAAGQPAYNVAKAAVLALIRSLDVDHHDQGIRANAILPSVIDTPANRESMPDADHSKWVTPDDIGQVIEFLVSDASSPVSGASIPVYGRA